MNPLDQYPEARKYLYMFQWVVSGILTLAGAYFLFSGEDMDDLPQWYVIAVGVAPILWTYLGITAQTNVQTKPELPVTPSEPMPQPPTEQPPMYPPEGS